MREKAPKHNEPCVAWPVGLYVQFDSQRSVGSILHGGVARRSFGLVRFDLWLQIDPSAAAPSAGYILRLDL
jgi:hypothetical protein